MMKTGPWACLFLFGSSGLLFAEEPVAAIEAVTVLNTNHYHHIDQALDLLRCTRADAGFAKDVVTNLLWSFPPVRGLLEDPFALDPLAGSLLAHMSLPEGPDAAAILARLNPPSESSEREVVQRVIEEHDHPIDPALHAFIRSIQNEPAYSLLAEPLGETFHPDLVSSHLMSQLDFLPWETLEPLLNAFGLGDSDTLRADRVRLDPSPAIERKLEQLLSIDTTDHAAAARELAQVLLAFDPATVSAWPDKPLELTPGIWVGTLGDDTYAAPFRFLIEPGGNDRYTGLAAAACPTNPVSILLEVAGHDIYQSDSLLGAGAALFGTCILLDRAGDDHYHAVHIGQGGALNGVAWHEDLAGNDTYRAAACSQGAAVNGFAVLHDRSGTDSYRVGQAGQGYAGVRGVGILVDRTGNDAYHAGGLSKVPWYPGQSFSMSQGFAIGERPLTGGGVGALIDLDGSDSYKADVYGQGVSYWYSLGMLYDRRGNDTYQMFHYGQGTGIHLSTGLLLDGDGKDTYSSTEGLSQGSAHDYAIGWLIDQGTERDQYSGDHFTQGRGMNNSFAMLLDEGGRDSYYARVESRAQGIGDNGRFREYGSLCLLLDLGGPDNYTTPGFENGMQLTRPDHGVLYDYEAPPKEVDEKK